MAKPTNEMLKVQLLKALPSDGSPKGNITLMRELGWSTTTYWNIHGLLLDEEKIVQGRGKGGSVFLVDPKEQVNKKKGKEKDLYKPIRDTLIENYVEQQNFTQYLLEITANSGPRNCGQWNRPDLLLVGVVKYELYIPRAEFKTVTFEVKPKSCNRLQAVYETASHSRKVHMSYLMMHVDEHDELQRETAECERFGIGLISFIDPSDYKTFNFTVDPQPSIGDAAETDDFLLSILDDKQRSAIRKWS